jgi:hypothetical protein
MAPQLSRFQHIKIEAILLSSGGDIYTIADIFAKHGDSELKETTLTDLRLWSLVKMSRDLS